MINDTTIILPDRRGNNRLDTLSNIVDTGWAGLIFFVPGIDEALRINGTALLKTKLCQTPACASRFRNAERHIIACKRHVDARSKKALSGSPNTSRHRTLLTTPPSPPCMRARQPTDPRRPRRWSLRQWLYQACLCLWLSASASSHPSPSRQGWRWQWS